MIRTAVAALALALVLTTAVATAFVAAAAADPAPPAADGRDRVLALRSFERFAAQWMNDRRTLDEHARATATREGGYLGVGPGYDVTLKATGNPLAPWVGLIRYAEHEYACRRAGCSHAASRHVTEIFRYQGGRWVY